jgi:hypothetical protein
VSLIFKITPGVLKAVLYCFASIYSVVLRSSQIFNLFKPRAAVYFLRTLVLFGVRYLSYAQDNLRAFMTLYRIRAIKLTCWKLICSVKLDVPLMSGYPDHETMFSFRKPSVVITGTRQSHKGTPFLALQALLQPTAPWPGLWLVEEARFMLASRSSFHRATG